MCSLAGYFQYSEAVDPCVSGENSIVAYIAERPISQTMRFHLTSLLSDEPDGLRGRIFGIYFVLVAFNLGAWLWAVIVFHELPFLLGTALFAYSLGLRHAVDADHIAAIDNVTRNLIQNGKRPTTVGLLFSLGHSTIVFIGAVAIAGTALSLQHRGSALKAVGGLIGTSVSVFFLFAIAALNLFALQSAYRAFARLRSGEPYVEADLGLLLCNTGLLSRIYRPMLHMISQSWRMYLLGLLFGLGFDTATEIGLLSISAAEVSRGLSLGSILIFPILFAAGMTLVDTTDNILMLGAYRWAFVKPIRTIYYNMTITCVSVIVAVAVGGIEALGLLAGQLHLEGGFWYAVMRLTSNFGVLGFCIFGLFFFCWIISIAVYKWRGFDNI
jgi:high-affinity nickel-transport protein